MPAPAATTTMAACVILVGLLFLGAHAFDTPKINPNLVVMFGLREEALEELEASGSLKALPLIGSSPHVLYNKKEVGIELQKDSYWKCTTGRWFLRVELSESGPVEALDPYPLASSVEYIDKATNKGMPLPSLLALQPLNPLAFSPYALTKDGNSLKGWKGTLACVEEGQPLQLFEGWPMFITKYDKASWHREVAVLSVLVTEPTWDPSAEPSFSRFKDKEGVLIHLTLQVRRSESPVESPEASPFVSRDAVEAEETPPLSERPTRGPLGGEVVTLFSLMQNKFRDSYLSKNQWIEELRGRLETGRGCVLHSSRSSLAQEQIDAADTEAHWDYSTESSEEQEDLSEGAGWGEVEMEVPPWVAAPTGKKQANATREGYVVWLKCPQAPAIVQVPFEAVLRSLSPSLRRVASTVLSPYKRWKGPSLLSAIFFLLSSIFLWSKEESLSRLGVPLHRIPNGPLDVVGQLSYASALAGSREPWVSSVFGSSPVGAFFAPDGRYYQTPVAATSVPLRHRARIVGGSVASSLGLAAAVIAGMGVLATTLKGIGRVALKKSKEVARGILHRAPWRKGYSPLLDRLAHGLLKGQAKGGGTRQVLLMVFDSLDPPTEPEALTESSAARTGTDGVVQWLQQRLAAQVVLLPINVFKEPFGRRHQIVVNTRARMSVGDFTRGLLLPHCRNRVEKHPELLQLFSLALAEPIPQAAPLSAASNAEDNYALAFSPDEPTARVRLLSPSLAMSEAVKLLNVYKGAHFIVSVGASSSEGLPGENPSGLTLLSENSSNAKVWRALTNHCLVFRKKPIVSMAAASISMRLNLRLPPVQTESCEWPGSSPGALVVQHVPPGTTVKQLLAQLLEALRSHGLLSPCAAPPCTERAGVEESSGAEAARGAGSDGEPDATAANVSPPMGGVASSASRVVATAAATPLLPDGLTERALALYVVKGHSGGERRPSIRGEHFGGSLDSRVTKLFANTGKEIDARENAKATQLTRVPFSSTVRDLLDNYGYDGVSFGFLLWATPVCLGAFSLSVVCSTRDTREPVKTAGIAAAVLSCSTPQPSTPLVAVMGLSPRILRWPEAGSQPNWMYSSVNAKTTCFRQLVTFTAVSI
ncbi:uncharacterized protein LOC34623279 [Cyclospora cayetanensis]|uniref:Uncharacterized protein LOC34623279 n=1 Tax=Cyclospora cayetanensis TaxID=88456 RepID=A0A6P6S264_9EIME|nr:uncharacterized protein LOC34623279 [Cyclospora cayetanensis]